ncbi:MAG: hypothetical protein ACOZNI_34935 [Myxococcota bacterium]
MLLALLPAAFAHSGVLPHVHSDPAIALVLAFWALATAVWVGWIVRSRKAELRGV